MARHCILWRRPFLFAGILLLLALGAILMVLPHPPAITVPDFEAARLRPDVDAYLAAAEARYPDIRPGAAKRVVWANPVTRQRHRHIPGVWQKNAP